MKLFAALALAGSILGSAPASAQEQLGEVQSYARIVAVQGNAMWPVSTITMTAMKPCGARVIGPIVTRISDTQVQVGVLLAQRPAMMACLAMPVPVQVTAQVYSETPVSIQIMNLRLDPNHIER